MFSSYELTPPSMHLFLFWIKYEDMVTLRQKINVKKHGSILSIIYEHLKHLTLFDRYLRENGN